MPVTWGDATSMMNRSWSGRRNGRHMLQSWPASSRHFWVAGSHLTMRPTGGTPPLGGSGSCVSRVIPGGSGGYGGGGGGGGRGVEAGGLGGAPPSAPRPPV